MVEPQQLSTMIPHGKGTNLHVAHFATGTHVLSRTGTTIMLGTILLIVLVLLVIGAIPNWNHSRSWGYAPSGGLGLVLVIVLILVLMGRI